MNAKEPGSVGGCLVAGIDEVDDFVLLTRGELVAASADAAFLSCCMQAVPGALAPSALELGE